MFSNKVRWDNEQMKNKKQLFLVSIDTEAPVGTNAVQHMIYGVTKDGQYGINHIMDILDRYRIKGLFFVDIAEAWHYGENEIKQVLLDIDSRGHDIGVHIHPDHMADSNRRFLWEYSYEEQFQIIKKCTDFYTTVLNRKPISFRAGRYGADNNTIHILSELGYKYDMSMYYGMTKRCKISDNYQTINAMKELPDGVIEVPVTVYKSFDKFGYKRFDKLDESLPFGEFKHLVQEIIKKGSVSVGSFFMHSFSFIDWRSNPDSPQYNSKSNDRIIKMIETIINDGRCTFISESDLAELNSQVGIDEELSTSQYCYSIHYSIRRAFKIVKEKMIRNV